jgi:hypothetical protein
VLRAGWRVVLMADWKADGTVDAWAHYLAVGSAARRAETRAGSLGGCLVAYWAALRAALRAVCWVER